MLRLGVGGDEPDAGIDAGRQPVDAATMATDTSEPGGATSIHRKPSASSASMRFSNPSWSMKKATLRS